MSDTDSQATIPEAARKLATLLGTWTVSGSMRTGERSAQVSGCWVFDRVANGHGIRVAGQTAIEGMGSFEEEELIGVDPWDGTLHFFSLNRFAVRDHRGGWTDEHTLYVEYQGDQGGEHCREGITIEISGDQMNSRILETIDGEPAITTILTLVRERSGASFPGR
ncbi:MAG TPA: hypothetical protein VF981_12020 [Gemmatimonadaceae bacterium]